MRPASAALLAVGLASVSQAQQPLSAIDWLKEPGPVTVAQPYVAPLSEPPVADGVNTPDIETYPLGVAHSDAVGLLPASTTGLPVTLWQASTVDAVASQFSQLGTDPLPAIQALYYTLLLAEAEAPTNAGVGSRFLKARIDALMIYGAVDPALALLERANPTTQDLFDRWLDLTLLAGSEDDACRALMDTPGLTSNYAKRIYCIARGGDWPTAALTYGSALPLRVMTKPEAELLAQYLDPETVDDTSPPVPPNQMTPLVFRLFESVGAPLPTRTLPRAYAVADLRETAGWKAQIEAAERLARTGALPANRLLGLYTERKPAASGGVWDRVAAIEAFDEALSDGDRDAISETLAPAWDAMQEQGLEVPFATFYGASLVGTGLDGSARALAFRIALLSPEYDAAAAMADQNRDDEAFLAGLASGAPNPNQAKTGLEHAIAQAFAANAPAPEYAPLLEKGELGRAILSAAIQLDSASRGQTDDIVAALATLRAVGLEDTARRAALQLLLLERQV